MIMTPTRAQLADHIHDLEKLYVTNTAQINALRALVATRDAQIVALTLLSQIAVDSDAQIVALKDFIETQDEAHADEMALLTNVNEAMHDRLNREVQARHERRAYQDALADGMPPRDTQGELMRQVRLLVAAQAYEILAGYGVHYREIARSVDDCMKSLEGRQVGDLKEPVLRAMHVIKSDCHQVADNIALCREGGIHEKLRALWPGSLEAAEASTEAQRSLGVNARHEDEQ